jgi:hypothetical protein
MRRKGRLPFAEMDLPPLESRDKLACPAFSPRKSWRCSRPNGHEGCHIACCDAKDARKLHTVEVVAVWDPTPTPTEGER